MKRIFLGAVLALTMLSVGCKSQAVKGNATTNAMEQTDNKAKLEGKWELIEIKARYMTTETMADLFPLKNPTIAFDFNEMKVYGNNGCNVFNGPLEQVTANTIELGQHLASTLKYCDGVNTLVYMNALAEVKQYQLDGEELALTSEDQTVVLKFKKVNN